MSCAHTRYHPSAQRMATRPTHPMPLAAFEVATLPPRAPRWSFAVRWALKIAGGALGFLLLCGAREVLHVVAGR